MALTLIHRMRFYRRFRTDIWGLGKLGFTKTNKIKYKRVTKHFSKKHDERKAYFKRIFSRYVYRVDIISPERKVKRIKKRFVTLRVVKLFYLTLTYKDFNKIARRSKKKDGSFENHYCLAIEGRLISFLYRTSFVSNMFEALFYVKHSYITLGRKVFDFANQKTGLFKILAIHPIIKRKFYYDLLVRLCVNKRSLFNAPSYIFVSY
jgi:hypothetical protein